MKGVEMETTITKEDVEKALDSLEVVKASEQDLDQPEGADMGNPAKEKMSDAAKAKKAACKKAEGEEVAEEEAEKAKKAKKAMPEMMEEKEEKEEEKKSYKKAKKSFSEDLPEEVQTKIDVSEFLKSLVDHTSEAVDGLAKELSSTNEITKGRLETLENGIAEIQESQAKVGIVLKAICERIGVVSKAPARTEKSETVAKSDAAPADREFSSGLEETQEKVFKSLSDNPIVAKAQISDALCELVKSGDATDLDVIGFESQSYIRPELVTKLKEKLN
jgi:hypothetical protein